MCRDREECARSGVPAVRGSVLQQRGSPTAGENRGGREAQHHALRPRFQISFPFIWIRVIGGYHPESGHCGVFAGRGLMCNTKERPVAYKMKFYIPWKMP